MDQRGIMLILTWPMHHVLLSVPSEEDYFLDKAWKNWESEDEYTILEPEEYTVYLVQCFDKDGALKEEYHDSTWCGMMIWMMDNMHRLDKEGCETWQLNQLSDRQLLGYEPRPRVIPPPPPRSKSQQRRIKVQREA